MTESMKRAMKSADSTHTKHICNLCSHINLCLNQSERLHVAPHQMTSNSILM